MCICIYHVQMVECPFPGRGEWSFLLCVCMASLCAVGCSFPYFFLGTSSLRAAVCRALP
jgi:hypothetical protein